MSHAVAAVGVAGLCLSMCLLPTASAVCVDVASCPEGDGHSLLQQRDQSKSVMQKVTSVAVDAAETVTTNFLTLNRDGDEIKAMFKLAGIEGSPNDWQSLWIELYFLGDSFTGFQAFRTVPTKATTPAPACVNTMLTAEEMEFMPYMDCLASLLEAMNAAGNFVRLLYSWWGLLNKNGMDNGICPRNTTTGMLTKGDAATSADPYVGNRDYQNTIMFTEYNITSVFEGYNVKDLYITGPNAGCMTIAAAEWSPAKTKPANPLEPKWQKIFDDIEKDLPITRAWLGDLSFICETDVELSSSYLNYTQRA